MFVASASRSNILDDNFETAEEENEDASSNLAEAVEYDTEQIFSDKHSINDNINKFRALCKKNNFVIKKTWSGETIPEVNRAELDMQIYSERILEIIARMLRKFEVVGYLPHYLKNNGELIRKYLPQDQAEFIIHKLAKTKQSIDSSNIRRKSIKSISTINSSTLPFSFDPDLETIIHYLAVNKCLDLIQQKRKLRVTDSIYNIIVIIKKLMDLVSYKFILTASAEGDRRHKLRDIYQDFIERTQTITRLENTLQEKQQESELKLKEKDVAIREYKTKVRRIRSYFKIGIELIVKESGSKMVMLDQQSGERSEILSRQANLAQQTYHSLVEDHLEKENMLRSKRFKIESQLAGWIAKFDQEVGGRQNQWDVLEEGYDTEHSELMELQCLFNEQDYVYKRYKAQKDAEDNEAFTNKLRYFVQNRSAKAIQRYWRAYKARKLSKKKSRKDKGKNKGAKKAKK